MHASTTSRFTPARLICSFVASVTSPVQRQCGTIQKFQALCNCKVIPLLVNRKGCDVVCSVTVVCVCVSNSCKNDEPSNWPFLQHAVQCAELLEEPGLFPFADTEACDLALCWISALGICWLLFGLSQQCRPGASSLPRAGQLVPHGGQRCILTFMSAQ